MNIDDLHSSAFYGKAQGQSFVGCFCPYVGIRNYIIVKRRVIRKFQSFCQKHVPANRTGIIFAMEPASGCIFSLIILGEVMSLYAWIGALLVMISLLYMEIATAKVEEKAEKPKAQGEVDTGINNRKAI